MNRLWVLLACLVFNFSSAHAFEPINERANPDELAAEIGVSARARVNAPRHARLQILIDKAVRRSRNSEDANDTGQTMQVYLDGSLIRIFTVSTGREQWETPRRGGRYFSRTPTGNFGIHHRNRRHFSRTWQAPMPYAQFIVGGIALHATTPEHYRELGRRASGGCIRLRNEDARVIWELVDEVGTSNTSISIIDSSSQFNWMQQMSPYLPDPNR